jgi:hypothetical protein
MHALAQFSPQQLLESGRRAEAEGRLDVAHQFYRYLADQYGYTAEAGDGRSGLARLSAAGHSQSLWQSASASPPPAPGNRHTSTRVRRGKPLESRQDYRGGRALAVLAAGSGWLAIGAALAAAGAGAAAHFLPAPEELKVTWNTLLLLAGVVAGGAGLVLAGQAARALFDQASAARELVAIERARRNGDPT